MSGGRRWTAEEDALIERWYPEWGTQYRGWWCRGGKLLEGRSAKGISIRAQKLGVAARKGGPHVWPSGEERMAVSMLADVCRQTGRSPRSVLTHLLTMTDRMERRARRRRSAV